MAPGARQTSPATAALLALLGRRWALRVIWELRGGALGFRELQARCDAMSASVLAERLAELREGGIVERSQGARHGLTRHGHELATTLEPLEGWSRRWARRRGGRPTPP